MSAPDLRARVTFAKRVDQIDAYGVTTGAWQNQFTVRARIWPRLGGETVIASRLQGTQPVTITVRQSSQTSLVGTDWKAINERTGVQYAVRSIVDPDERNADHDRYLDLLCETGVAE